MPDTQPGPRGPSRVRGRRYGGGGGLALVGDMRSDPGDELQVVHPLRFSGLFAIPIADLACAFIQGEPIQGQKRPDHVFAHPLESEALRAWEKSLELNPAQPDVQKAVNTLKQKD